MLTDKQILEAARQVQAGHMYYDNDDAEIIEFARAIEALNDEDKRDGAAVMSTDHTELRALAEAVKDWSNCNQAWPHPDPDIEGIAIMGAIDEDGNRHELAVIDAGTYGFADVSIKLARFYAAANPNAVLALLERIAELERWQDMVRENSPLLRRIAELEAELSREAARDR